MNIMPINSVKGNSCPVGVKKDLMTQTFRRKEILKNDIFEEHSTDRLSKEEKQQILKKARVRAAAWSILGGLITTVIYALKDDKSIAKKNDLDIKDDKDFVHKVRMEQIKWSLPGALGVGLIAWIIALCKKSENITID